MFNRQNRNCVSLDGEWDFSRKQQLVELVATLNGDKPATIDLSACTYADSTVLGIFVGLKRKFGDVPITLLAPNPHILRILKIVGFDKIFPIAGTD